MRERRVQGGCHSVERREDLVEDLFEPRFRNNFSFLQDAHSQG
jgi:hypothetical protein